MVSNRLLLSLRPLQNLDSLADISTLFRGRCAGVAGVVVCGCHGGVGGVHGGRDVLDCEVDICAGGFEQDTAGGGDEDVEDGELFCCVLFTCLHAHLARGVVFSWQNYVTFS